ncbi:YcaO-like family protein [Bacillus sp. DJP31]|uniref:YcaO-like family protein n=1 Tax=Bacillus sp. DJP31 TaxID=3409789 RepID=UPI003BB7356F
MKLQYTDADQLVKSILKKEPDATKYLNSFMSLVDPSLGIIRYFDKEQDYYGDEPNFTAFRAEIFPTSNYSHGGYKTVKAEGGRSLYPDQARVGALFESFERYCLSIYKIERLIYSSFNQLTQSGVIVEDPMKFVSSEQSGREELREEKMMWTSAWSIRYGKEILIPAQCVYLPYQFQQGEPVLRDPLTTGAAAGLTLGKAILRGLLEVIERDSTMIVHYRKIKCQEIDLSQVSGTLKSLIDSLKRYNLEYKIYDYSLDIPVPVVVCKIIDRSGVGPTCTVGAKASFSQESAILGAILEAGSLRLGIRGVMEEARKESLIALNDYSKLDTANRRSFLWSQPEMLHHLDYQDDSNEKSIKFKEWDEMNEERLKELINVVLEKGGDIIIKDVTTYDIGSYGVKVVKVIVPGLQPMHLFEPECSFSNRILEFGGERMNPDSLNMIPHPFG